MRIPTDEEIDAAARQLGIAVAGKCPRSRRAKVAKALQLAASETEQTATAELDLDDRIAAIVGVYRRLQTDLGASAAEAITASLAPTIYRTAPKGNRTNATT